MYMVLPSLLVLLLLPVSAAADEPPENAGGNQTRRMTMSDVVYLTIRNNVNVRTNYLDRVLEKFDLEEAEAKYEPTINLDGSLNADALEKNRRQAGHSKQASGAEWEAGAEASLTQKVPTGGELSFIWENSRRENTDGSLNYNEDDDSLDRSRDYSAESKSSWRVEFKQPLLKGAGIDYNMASIRLARIKNQRNILNLRDNLSGLINEGLNLFFTFVQAEKNHEIQRRALERSERLLEINRVKVSMGRMAKSDVVQAEADVASGELSLEEALNSLDEARRNLLNHLELDPNTVIEPVKQDYEIIQPNYDECMAVALKSNRAYLDKTFAVTESKINYMMAENERMWELGIKTGYGETHSDRDRAGSSSDSEMSAGIEFKAPINLWGEDRLSRERKLLDATVEKRRAELNLKKAEVDLQTEVANTVRNVKMRLKMIGMAKRNAELKAMQLENENAKLMVGRSTNFEVVSYQNQLVQAQLDEVSNSISYIQALLDLDQILGSTMETWHIDFKRDDVDLERELNDEVRPLMWTWW